MPRFRVLAVALLGLAGFAGCGGGADDPATSQTTEGRPTESLIKAPLAPRRVFPNQGRTNYFRTAGGELDPPLRKGRTIVTHVPIKAAPVVANGVAYIVSRLGTARIVSLDTGHVFWEESTFPVESRSRELTAPIVGYRQLFILTDDGYEIAMGVAEQEYEWSSDTHTRVNAPPTLVNEITYFIANGTTLIGLNEGNLSKIRGLGVVRSSPSYSNHRLFVANLSGSVISIGTRKGTIPKKGEILWRTDTSEIPSLGEGGFSLAPALAFGRVYAAREDGAVVALDQPSGKITWYAKAGGAAAGSLAVAKVPGTAPTVYVASRSGGLYAFDARSGKRLWRYDVGGKIVAPMAVVGHTAYVSTAKKTVGIDVRTVKKNFELSRGPLTPVGTDRNHIYMAGEGKLIGFESAGH
jgi:outer membrane protein assembly factor BamB